MNVGESSLLWCPLHSVAASAHQAVHYLAGVVTWTLQYKSKLFHNVKCRTLFYSTLNDIDCKHDPDIRCPTFRPSCPASRVGRSRNICVPALVCLQDPDLVFIWCFIRKGNIFQEGLKSLSIFSKVTFSLWLKTCL